MLGIWSGSRPHWVRILLATVILSVAIGGAAAAAEPQRGGELNIALFGEPPSLDPHLEPSSAAARVHEQIYETLVQLDTQMQLVPCLAESWETPNATTYIFHLKEGVTFHNGREMTSADVKYSFERIMNPDTGALAFSYLEAVERIETPDPYTVIVYLEHPFAPFLTNLASFYTAIVPREVVEEHGNLSRVAVGTGPFRLVEHEPDNYVRLERYGNYHVNGLPYLDGITFRVMTDEATRQAAIRTGQVHLTELQASSTLVLQNSPGVTVEAISGLSYQYLGMNNARKPFDDPRVRQAVSYAISREVLVEAAVEGEGEVSGPVPPAMGQWAADLSRFPSYRQDLQQSRKLLAEAGYPNGFRTTLLVGREQEIDIATAAQALLAQVGITVEIERVEWGAYVSRWSESDFDMIAGANQGRADPDEYTYFHFHSAGSANIWNFSDPELDVLLVEARREPDPDLRREMYHEAQERIVEQSPILFLYSPNIFYGVRDTIQGFSPMPNAQMLTLKETWLQ